jgi:glycerol-3-phosphate cytidylyltransferase-like family protein
MHSEERYESLRHLKWVDEVVENAPWTVDKEFIEKWEIDYVAHDEEPYVSAGSQDVYAYAKSIGKSSDSLLMNSQSLGSLSPREFITSFQVF